MTDLNIVFSNSYVAKYHDITNKIDLVVMFVFISKGATTRYFGTYLLVELLTI